MASGSDPAGAGDRVPMLAPGCDPTRLALTPSEGFLLSRVDGHTPWALLREIGGLPPEQVDECLERWHADGVLVSSGCAAANDTRSAAAEAGSSEAGAATPRPNGKSPGPELAVDPSLDLDVETQKRILALQQKIDGPYHQILGVPRDASVKVIKRAYITLSKEYHPDRYFRRNIGGFAELLDRVFKKILEAYELLSDPTTRAEVERFLQQEEPPQAASASGGGAEPADQARKRELLERIRKRFKIPQAILNERKLKARQFAHAAGKAAQMGNWLEAAGSIRLAIAFDPWNDEYKAPFADIQAQALVQRAARLVEEAEASRGDEGAKGPLRLYEEALHCRPYDPEINHKAASTALSMGEQNLALEYAQRACELCPDDGRYRITLGEVFKEAGRLAEATEQYEKAVELGTEDAKAKQGLEAVKRESRRRRKLGGKR